MSIAQLENIMVEYGVIIRAIPEVIVNYLTIQEKHITRKNTNRIYYDFNRSKKFNRACYFEEKIKYPEMAGKFLILSNCGNGSMIQFTRKEKYFDTIEDAVNSLKHIDVF